VSDLCFLSHSQTTSTHCAYPQRDGQAELAWVAYLDSHPSKYKPGPTSMIFGDATNYVTD